ncbi:MAG: DUF3667 domain-containing protein [Bacteroidaceae bacterium]|nr:DUF3667 domain-containing protein [Bacteroidaceae bacterium]
MTTINQHLSRFRQWQRDTSRHIARPSDAPHHCRCCGTDFTGNFCPQCGQKADVERISWKTVRRGFAILWGMDSRSLPYTLWQLLLRPGYLIGDYLSGKRQVSFPPVKMLALVAVFVFFALNAMAPSSVDEEIENFGSGFIFFNNAVPFFNDHLDVAVLFFLSLLIIPTYFIFRFAPRYPRHNLPEGLFIQVFDSTAGVLLIFVVSGLCILFGNEELADEAPVVMAMGIVVTYRSYHQLFGYSHWGTLWRTLAVFLAAWMLLAVLLFTDNVVSLSIIGDYGQAFQKFVHRFLPFLLALAVSLAIPYFISRRTARRRAGQTEPII